MESICNSCPRKCGVERPHGFCGAGDTVRVSHYMKHMWEEPFISGKNGSGAVFFSGCNLGCVFCQNHEISHECNGREVSTEELRGIFCELISQGVHNINLVTPTHFLPQLIPALSPHPEVPVVYNCSGYEGNLKPLEGLCDIYLCDLKYGNREAALRYSSAPDYPDVCLEALEEMYRQVGDFEEKDGIMTRGVVVRHLVLPSNADNSLDAIDLFKKFSKGKRVKFSLMCQYVPHGRAAEFPEINRTLTAEEYDRVINYALRRGITDCLIQEMTSASKEFIPFFSS